MTPRRWFWILLGAALVWLILGARITPYRTDPRAEPRLLQRVHGGLGTILAGTLIPLERYVFSPIQAQIARLAPLPSGAEGQSNEELAKQIRVLERRLEATEGANRAMSDKLIAYQKAGEVSAMIEPRHLVSARIDALSLTPAGDSAQINRGAQHGLRPGMAVLCDMAVVGRIIQVGPVTADVQFVTDPRIKVSATLQRRAPEGNSVIAQCMVRGDGFGVLRCDSIGKTYTSRDGQTRVILPPEKGDRLMLSDPSWPPAVQNVEFGVVTDVTSGPNLFYSLRAQSSEDMKRQPALMVLLLDK